MLIRKDAKGLYVRNARGEAYRPGGVVGYDHAFDMTNGGLQEGDNPKATHVSGAPLLRIRLEDRTLYWATEDTKRR